MKYIKWTDENIKFLADNYYIKGAVYCAEYLGISVKNVDIKVRKLKNKVFFKTKEPLKYQAFKRKIKLLGLTRKDIGSNNLEVYEIDMIIKELGITKNEFNQLRNYYIQEKKI